MNQKRPFYIQLVAEKRKELITVFPEFLFLKKKVLDASNYCSVYRNVIPDMLSKQSWELWVLPFRNQVIPLKEKKSHS